MPKLLVVDGSPMMHRIMELTFAPEGIQVVTASDGDQARALLPIARPDIVIADHAVSGTSGYDLSAFVRSHPDLGRVPVLLLASPFEPLDRRRAEACGVAGEIAKPFEPAQLIARVRELLTPKPEPQPERAPEPELEAEAPLVAAEGRSPALKLVEPPSPPGRGALDDYFDRLDAALERLDDQIARAGAPQDHEESALPTIDTILGEERNTSRGAVLIDHPLRGAYTVTEDSGSSGAAGAANGDDAGNVPVSASKPGDAEEAASELAPGTPAAFGPTGSAADMADAESGRGRDLSSLVQALEALRRRSPADAPLPALPFTGLPPATKPTAEATEAMIEEVTRRVLERLAPGAVDRIVTDIVTQVAEKLLREEISRLK